MTEQENTQTVEVRTVRQHGTGRMFSVRRTWAGRGTRRVRIVRTEQKRATQARWHTVTQTVSGETVSTVWQ